MREPKSELSLSRRAFPWETPSPGYFVVTLGTPTSRTGSAYDILWRAIQNAAPDQLFRPCD